VPFSLWRLWRSHLRPNAQHCSFGSSAGGYGFSLESLFFPPARCPSPPLAERTSTQQGMFPERNHEAWAAGSPKRRLQEPIASMRIAPARPQSSFMNRASWLGLRPLRSCSTTTRGKLHGAEITAASEQRIPSCSDQRRGKKDSQRGRLKMKRSERRGSRNESRQASQLRNISWFWTMRGREKSKGKLTESRVLGCLL
jgi:hypothetical protein